MLRPDEIARIRTKAQYSDETDEWNVPPFIFKQKDLVFPKLNGMSLVSEQHEKRDVQFLGEGPTDKASMNVSARGSDNKSKNAAAEHDALSGGGLQSYRKQNQ